jgi:hypothetical protein
MDGSLAVYYHGQCLANKPAPPEAPVLRARNTARVMPKGSDQDELAAPLAVKKNSEPKTPYKPGLDHPWRRPFKVKHQ